MTPRLPMLVLWLTCVFASHSSADIVNVEHYAATLKSAQQQFNEGDFSGAEKTLSETDPQQRGIEFALLEKMVQTRKSLSDPAIIQTIANPADVKARYGLLNPVSQQVVFICQDGSLRRRSLHVPEEPLENLEHPDQSAVWRGAFSADGKRFFAAHGNGDVVVWDAAQWERLQTVSLGDDPVTDLAVSTDGRMFAATGAKSVELWRSDSDVFEQVAQLHDRLRFGNGIAISPDGKLVATGGMFAIVINNAVDGSNAKQIEHASYTMGMLFSPDSATIASAPRGNINKLLGLFRVNDGEPVFRKGPFEHYIAGMVFTPDGRRLLCTGCEKRIRIFDTATGVVVLDLPREECSAEPVISADGQVIGWSEPSGFRFINLNR